MTSYYPEPFVDQIYSQLAMPAVSQLADLSFAWALVCIYYTSLPQTLYNHVKSNMTRCQLRHLQDLTCHGTQVRGEESNRIDRLRNVSVTSVASSAVELESRIKSIGASGILIGSATPRFARIKPYNT